MPIGTISAMPAAPSRIGDPTNFVTESLAFLDAQVGFVTQCNSVATYINAAKFNPYSWGNLGAITGASPVSITNFIAEPPNSQVLSGQALATAIDSVMASFNPFITDANTVGTYIDSENDPLNPVIVDPARPVIPTVQPTPLRNDGATAFETKSLAFYNSARAFSYALQNMANYVATFSSGFEDWGSIAITYTDSDDWGFTA